MEKWHYALTFIVTVLAAVFSGFLNHSLGYSVFNLGMVDGDICTASYKPSWNGGEIGCNIGRGGIPTGLSDADYLGYLAGGRAGYEEYLNNNNIIPDVSRCEITVQMGTCYDGCLEFDEEGKCVYFQSGCTALPDELYNIPKDEILYGTFKETGNKGTSNYFVQMSSGGKPYYYHKDYKCVLDNIYPTDLGLPTEEMIYTIKAKILPAPIPGQCDVASDCSILEQPEDINGNWGCVNNNCVWISGGSDSSYCSRIDFLGNFKFLDKMSCLASSLVILIVFMSLMLLIYNQAKNK